MGYQYQEYKPPLQNLKPEALYILNHYCNLMQSMPSHACSHHHAHTDPRGGTTGSDVKLRTKPRIKAAL